MESVDNYEGGGSSRISVEGFVMELERRGCTNSNERIVKKETSRNKLFLRSLEIERSLE